jgi:predicted metal-dependent phosphoesterase TrpH
VTTYLNADLHCHSVVSDGTLTPEDLAARAKANGVELWALTDHDEIGGQHRAAAAARSQGMAYLTGTEISVTFAGNTVHIVGLGFDPDNAALARAWPPPAAGAASARRKWRRSWRKWASTAPTKARCSLWATPS